MRPSKWNQKQHLGVEKEQIDKLNQDVQPNGSDFNQTCLTNLLIGPRRFMAKATRPT